MSTAAENIRPIYDADISIPQLQVTPKTTAGELKRDQLLILREFLMTKKIEGCRPTTLNNYYRRIIQLINWSEKDIRELNSKELRHYLYEYQAETGISNTTLDNMRLVFSSFYEFMEEEDYILKNPMKKIHRIKHDEIVKKPFTDEELERIRKGAKTIRDLAIIDLLYSSGIRISELVSINISDVNFADREFIIMGKGRRERVCYFNARTKIEIEDYLTTRLDKDPALFVSVREPTTRITVATIQKMLKKIEEEIGVKNIHPHRFRRTLATNLLMKGMTIEQVQTVLGHKRIETTLIYTTLDKTTVKSNHQKYTF